MTGTGKANRLAMPSSVPESNECNPQVVRVYGRVTGQTSKNQSTNFHSLHCIESPTITPCRCRGEVLLFLRGTGQTITRAVLPERRLLCLYVRMGEVVDIWSNQPHLAGEVICVACKHEWIGVIPVDYPWVECPKCHAHRGCAKHNIGTDKPRFCCNKCNTWIFIILADGAQCMGCGNHAPWKSFC